MADPERERQRSGIDNFILFVRGILLFAVLVVSITDEFDFSSIAIKNYIVVLFLFIITYGIQALLKSDKILRAVGGFGLIIVFSTSTLLLSNQIFNWPNLPLFSNSANTSEVIKKYKDSIICYLDFEEGVKNLINGKGIRVLSDEAYVTNEFGKGYSPKYDASGPLVLTNFLTKNYNFDSNDSFSILLWVKAIGGDYRTTESVISRINSNPPFDGWALNFIGPSSVNDCLGGKLTFGFAQEKKLYAIKYDKIMSNGNWYHIAITYNGNLSHENPLKLYVDGSRQNSKYCGQDAFDEHVNVGQYDLVIGSYRIFRTPNAET